MFVSWSKEGGPFVHFILHQIFLFNSVFRSSETNPPISSSLFCWNETSVRASELKWGFLYRFFQFVLLFPLSAHFPSFLCILSFFCFFLSSLLHPQLCCWCWRALKCQTFYPSGKNTRCSLHHHAPLREREKERVRRRERKSDECVVVVLCRVPSRMMWWSTWHLSPRVRGTTICLKLFVLFLAHSLSLFFFSPLPFLFFFILQKYWRPQIKINTVYNTGLCRLLILFLLSKWTWGKMRKQFI